MHNLQHKACTHQRIMCPTHLCMFQSAGPGPFFSVLGFPRLDPEATGSSYLDSPVTRRDRRVSRPARARILGRCRRPGPDTRAVKASVGHHTGTLMLKGVSRCQGDPGVDHDWAMPGPGQQVGGPGEGRAMQREGGTRNEGGRESAALPD
jgi:hypothetical protein